MSQISKKRAAKLIEHRVVRYLDDTEGSRPGFCSLIASGDRIHQVDVIGTQFGDYRWRVFHKVDQDTYQLIDSDIEPSLSEACHCALNCYATSTLA